MSSKSSLDGGHGLDIGLASHSDHGVDRVMAVLVLTALSKAQTRVDSNNG